MRQRAKKNRPDFVFGKTPYCNRKPERAPHIGEFCFPLCWRCCGGIAGLIFASVMHQVGYLRADWNMETMLLCLALFLPAFCHFQVNKIWGRETKNWMRFVTGVLLGIAIEIPVLCLVECFR